ncbi:TetR/AcrR family transcriptional regulator [Actinomadura viridis]|uniref:AcrR family transcriptional regulator n=1 Tax=Actinomadura viridis TaxID=58110 RepID=A0A931DSF7_9ACTN|nr:TetR/AcrR family transcriptional regulator [Actinomadura viridis]MBG6093016.1 AcrR family transcriptional regulator [Actinomadura viridis]
MARGQRAKILEHSGRLFSLRGIGATTIREIAESVGLNSGTLYHYFASKDDIASEILVGFLEDLSTEYERVSERDGTARENILELVRTSLRVAARHPYATEIYQNEQVGRLPSLPRYDDLMKSLSRCHETWDRVVRDGVARGELRADIGEHNFQRILRELVFMTVRWNRESLAEEAGSLAEILTSGFLDGFATRPEASGTAPGGHAASPGGAVPSPGEPDAQHAEIARLRSDVEELKQVVETIRRDGTG